MFYYGLKLIKTQNFLHSSYKKFPFTQNFAKQPYFFLLKVLRIIFYPPKVRNSKPDRGTFFGGTDTLYISTSTIINI